MSTSSAPAPESPSAVAAADSAGEIDIAAVFRAHQPTVLRWAIRLGGPGIDADDVVQDVFLVAKRRLRSFVGPGQITTWLFRTTEKVVQSARRKQRLRRWLSLSVELGPMIMGTREATPADQLQSDRDVAEVYRVLDCLPQRERRVIILFELEDLSTEEIAVLLGAKVGTVRVWLFRARARFQQEHRRMFRQDDGRQNQ